MQVLSTSKSSTEYGKDDKRTHCFIDRIREITSLELGKETKRDVSRAWNKEKILGLHEESNLRPSQSDSALRCPNTEPQTTVSEVYYEVYMIRVLCIARISNVDSVMFVNRIREIASFELGKEIEQRTS